MALKYDRILRHKQIRVNKSDTIRNWSFNTLCESLKAIIVLYEIRVSSTTPEIRKVSVIIEGKPNQLYANEMCSFEQYDEVCKYFEKRKQRDADAFEVQKQL